MASQSLYRKWRSQTFDEVVGQQEIIRTLRNALIGNHLRHAYLFTGPRGTGKTTTARLLAKTVNCLNPQNGEPCNECQQCREITAGISFNVIEIDAASNRGIDSIRELREKVMMPPSTGKYKIYILDEAHMLTTEAFNALLKTLEEPPEYAIFVMATTDVHKMLPTVLSRCQRFDFKRIATRQIVQHLLFVAAEEEVQLERSAAELIARTAAGGMRDALSLLDQAIAYAGNTVSLAQVQSMLGLTDPRAIGNLIGHIAHQDAPALLYLIHELAEAGADLRQVNAQVIEYWRALLLAKAEADIATILDLTEDETNEVQQLVSAFTLEELTECARTFAQNELMQRNSATPQLGLELASLDCLELHRRVTSGGMLAKEPVRTTEPLPPLTRSQKPAPASRESTASQTPPPPTARVVREPSPTQEDPFPPIPSTPPATGPFFTEKQDLPTGIPESQHTSLTMQQVMASWENVKKRTMQRNSLVGTYVSMCDIVGIEEDGEYTVIVIRAAKPLHFKTIKDNNHPKDVEWALSTEFSIPCKIRVLPPGQAYSGTRAQNSVGTLAPAQSAYREPAPVQIIGEVHPTLQAQTETRAPAAVSPDRPSKTPEAAIRNVSTQLLARQQGVRENKKVVLSKEELGQKVEQDPVVQEFVRTFGANIADIQPK